MLLARILPVDGVDGDLERGMFSLYDTYYEGGSLAVFSRDLRAKSHVVLITEGAEVLGFTIFDLRDHPAPEGWTEGAVVRVAYSGDTVMDQRYWGRNLLGRPGIQFLGHAWAQAPEVPLFHYSLMAGYRTYRVFSGTYRETFPNPRCSVPAPVQALLDDQGRRRFGAAYDAATGIVHMPPEQGKLRPAWSEIPDSERDRRPLARFLAERNPGHRDGDDLTCIARVCPDNISRAVARLFDAGTALVPDGEGGLHP